MDDTIRKRFYFKYNKASKKLRAIWTPELAQELEAYHSIDAEVDRELDIDRVDAFAMSAMYAAGEFRQPE